MESARRGRLTRPWDSTTTRSEHDEFGQRLYQPEDRQIVERVVAMAGAQGVSPAQIALAWLLSRPAVDAPIVGATKLEHLADAVAALDVELTAEECTALEAPYAPHRVAGHT